MTINFSLNNVTAQQELIYSIKIMIELLTKKLFSNQITYHNRLDYLLLLLKRLQLIAFNLLIEFCL